MNFDFNGLFRAIGIAFVITTPLAIWKLIDIILWVFKNVKISWAE